MNYRKCFILPGTACVTRRRGTQRFERSGPKIGAVGVCVDATCADAVADVGVVNGDDAFENDWSGSSAVAPPGSMFRGKTPAIGDSLCRSLQPTGTSMLGLEQLCNCSHLGASPRLKRTYQGDCRPCSRQTYRGFCMSYRFP